MDGYTKQRCSDWSSPMELDMSVCPGTVIRPDMPLGSGPAKSLKNPSAPIPMRQQDLSRCPSYFGSMNCPEMPPKPMKCPSQGVSPAVMKCPEMPPCPMPCPSQGVSPAVTKCPEMPPCPRMYPDMPPCRMRPNMPPMGVAPGTCTDAKPADCSGAECIDRYPVGMAYVPWQRWQELYSVDTAIEMGTIFPDLFKPFLMGGCK